MTAEDVIVCFENAWRALSDENGKNPTEDGRIAMNTLSRMINEVKRKIREEEKEQTGNQISIEEWMNWLNN